MNTPIITLNNDLAPTIQSRGELLRVLPEYMTNSDCRRWLVWRSIPQENGGKPRKKPYYTNGYARGKTDTLADWNQLVSFDEAYAVLATGTYTGLGFTLGSDSKGGCWQGIDLDDIWNKPELHSLKLPGYVELSPSGKGLHAIGYGKDFDTLGSNHTGIEAYSHGRFFTMTGMCGKLFTGHQLTEHREDLFDYVEQVLRPMHETTISQNIRITLSEPKKPIIITPQLLADLESALKFISADEGKTWIAMGYALHELGDAGYKLWAEWSATSEKHNADIDLARWSSLKAERTSHKAVFARAQKNGWENPRKQADASLIFINGQWHSNTRLDSQPILVNQPEPLPDPRPDVIKFQPEMLPEPIRDFVFDIAHRQQSQPDFVAIAAIVGLSGLLGRKALICPKQLDDWTVTPNQWGVIIGRPSAMKSPSMKEALKPLKQIEANAAKHHKNEIKRYNAECALMEIEKPSIKNQVKIKVQSGDREGALRLLENSDNPALSPTRNRLIVNDSTIEKLGELLNENTNGLLLVRDELSGWLTKLAKEEFQSDRAFYLECFDGNGTYTYDRIGRGTIEIQNCTLSIIGGIQPTKIATLVCDAMTGVADDGLIQRFQLAVWPDDVGKWEWIDQEPNKEAKIAYYAIFDTIHNLAFETTDGEPPRFRFTTNEAQLLFTKWMEKIQVQARGDEVHPALESHMLKMPQTIASLALLFEIIDGGRKVVGLAATKRALMWAEYLLSHANRLYSIATNQSIDNARLILNRKNNLSNPFTARDIERKNWTGLKKKVAIIEALDCLIDYKYLISKQLPTTSQGGAPSTIYQWVESEYSN